MHTKEFVSAKLVEMYNDGAAHQDDGWIIILDNLEPNPLYGSGSASPEKPSGWKVHISIHQEDISKAIPVLCNVLLDDDVRMGFKVINALGFSDFEKIQPAKQVALIFGEEVSFTAMQKTISDLEYALKSAGIRPESRALNSRHEQSKFDAQIKNDDGTPSYFGYRNDNAVVVDDSVMNEDYPKLNFAKEGSGYLVRQSYYTALPEAQKHNPANEKDPFKEFVLSSQKQLKEPDLADTPLVEGLSDTGSAQEVSGLCLVIGLTIGVFGGFGALYALRATTNWPQEIVPSVSIVAGFALVGAALSYLSVSNTTAKEP